MGKFAVSIEHSEAKSASASEGFATLTLRPRALPLDPLEAPPTNHPYRLVLCALAMPPLDCGPPAGGKLTKWPAVSKRLDSTDVTESRLLKKCI